MSHDDFVSASPEFRSDIEHGHDEYTAEELLEQSQLNAQALILGAFGACKDDPVMLDRITAGIATTFAKGWDTSRNWEKVEILDALLTNYRALGATVEQYDPQGGSPNATLVGVPDEELVEMLEVAGTAFRPMLMVSERLVKHLGFELEWSHDVTSRRIRLQVNRLS